MSATSMNTDPRNVYRKNFNVAYTRRGPPHTPMMRNIGMSMASQKK